MADAGLVPDPETMVDRFRTELRTLSRLGRGARKRAAPASA
jgi:hypothetical protein